MKRVVMLVTTAVLLSSSHAFSQSNGVPVAPGISQSGLGSLGVGSAVAPTGIPLGATELSTPGTSPMTLGASSLGLSGGNSAVCSGVAGSMPEASAGTSNTDVSAEGMSSSVFLFDGGGATGNASGTCPPTAGGLPAGPAASASSPPGMGAMSPIPGVGIPLGSTELGVGGLSPPSLQIPNTAAPIE